jgi:hypothetical protein
LDSRGAIVLREKVARGGIGLRLANLPPCLIGIEAGLATHCVARELAALGNDVKQVPPTYAKPFRQGHKNDFRDAQAVAEAVQRPTTPFVSPDGLRKAVKLFAVVLTSVTLSTCAQPPVVNNHLDYLPSDRLRSMTGEHRMALLASTGRCTDPEWRKI